jgi:signal transduction histidine kinase
MVAPPGLLIRWILCTLLAACGQVTAQPTPNADSTWRIVLIRSWDSLYPVNVRRETAMREVILENSPRIVDFFPEELDPLRFQADLERDFVALLQRKYKDTRIDLVIASGIEPLEFAARHRDLIWPGAAIVFNGVYEGGLRPGWTLPSRTTGLIMMLDVQGTLELGRALVPNARRLYVVSGDSDFDRYIRRVVGRKLDTMRPPIEMHEVAGLTRAETADRVSRLEKDSLVLYLTMLRDGDGELSGPLAPAMRQVAERSAVPMLSVFHTQFGRGPIGGSAPRTDVHGRQAGAIARRVLEGADAAQIPVAMHPMPECEVDWNALQRWNLESHRVPSRCTLANVQPAAWRGYVWPLIGLLAVILAQTALIYGLIVQSRRRHRAEGELKARAADLAHVGRLSTIGALTASIAHEINQPMGAILSNAEAAEMMLAQGTLDSDKLREILADIRNEDLRASEVIRSLRKLLTRRDWKPEAVELNQQVAEALGHLAFDAARRLLHITPVFGARLPAVRGVAVQLQQVVINLVMNAMEALETSPPNRREVRVETRAVNGGVEIAVSDHGPGLTREEAAKAFETTFTTKHDGMGFGLAIVASIVKEHRGRVTYEPNDPHGAVFRVWLPEIGK